MPERLRQLRNSPLRYFIPNTMTLVRPPLSHQAMQKYKEGKKWGSCGLFITAGLTDMEGRLARRLDATSSTGRVIDPLADRVMMTEFMNTVDADERAQQTIIVAESIISLTALALLAFRKSQGARVIGKKRMVAHVAAGATLIAFGENEKVNKAASWTMAGASVAAAIDYGIQAYKTLKK